jgi:Uma2 family endonuclease
MICSFLVCKFSLLNHLKKEIMTTPSLDSLKLDSLKLNLIAWITQIEDEKVLDDLIKIKNQIEPNGYATNDTTEGELDVPTPRYYTPKSAYTVEDIQAIANQFPKDKKWTYTDLCNIFPPDLKVKVEILNNQLIIMASPSFIHQKISNELSFEMTSFVKKNKLGEVLCAPMDVKFDENNVEQPDIFFISITRYDIIQENVIDGSPDVLVEIISPSNTKKEQEEKHTLYEEKGVKEYWTIFPKNRYIKVEVLQDGVYQVYSEGEINGVIRSFVLEGFEINVLDVMPDSLYGEREKSDD